LAYSNNTFRTEVGNKNGERERKEILSRWVKFNLMTLIHFIGAIKFVRDG
jgi:hypothetical protein